MAWNKCNNEQLLLYRSILEQELENISLPEQCRPVDINQNYENIVNAIHKAADLALPHSKFNKHAKPYRTPEVRAAHTQERNKRRQWVEHGRPRNREDFFYRSYKESKRHFRKLQKSAIANIELKYYKDLNSSADCDMRHFWHLVNQRRKIKSSSVCKLKRGDTSAFILLPISKNLSYKLYYVMCIMSRLIWIYSVYLFSYCCVWRLHENVLNAITGWSMHTLYQLGLS